ncbi:PASTA domain-containing protein [Jiulongibacter sediminis]|uniref:Penicillin-binding protein n=1 Tax=Jiulongibacter sediminis TaxID=1605367 RepID=A0A0P7BQ96_9BACT|nr:PASTA domain-containing protein [Jiulongibacter sediminis]KPM49321.1 penicillin-binding protein [Jiulongibacter sediminis]TBX26372.1 penicillin-binding protein [Jiulongibacter sediminis]
MPKLSTNSKTDLLTHIGIILATALVLFFAFFFIYLPWTTNHGESVQVPDLKGLTLDEVESVLDDNDLKYEVSDSTFVIGQKPLTVFSHYPKPESPVKKGRKIFLTIITDQVPKVSIPNVVGRSVNSAANLLSSVGLQVGQTEFIPAIEKNTVLRLKYDGAEVSTGKSVPKGSKITLVAGDGFGNTTVAVPDLTGMSYDEADILVAGSSLNIGNILYDNASDQPQGTVVRQRPAAGTNLRIGDEVNIWLSGSN